MAYDYPTPISVRVPTHEERAVLEAVAEWQGVQLSTFVREAAILTARAILEEHGSEAILEHYRERSSRVQQERAAKEKLTATSLEALLDESPPRPAVLVRSGRKKAD